MKNIKIFVCLLIVVGCKAQTLSSLNEYDATSTSHFVDLEGELNKFVGTWEYTNGSTTFIVTLQKKTAVPTPNGHFEDLIVGEYSYSVGNNTIVNTLPNLLNPSIIGRYHNIAGREFWPIEYLPNCDDCAANERILKIDFRDPAREYLNTACIIRFIVDSIPHKIKFSIINSHMVMLPTVDSPTEPRVPYGEYLMIKQ